MKWINSTEITGKNSKLTNNSSQCTIRPTEEYKKMYTIF